MFPKSRNASRISTAIILELPLLTNSRFDQFEYTGRSFSIHKLRNKPFEGIIRKFDRQQAFAAGFLSVLV